MIEYGIPLAGLIAAAAVLAPIIAEGARRFLAVPEVVIQILLGIAPGALRPGPGHPNSVVTALSDFGLTFLMFLAGTELDLGHRCARVISGAPPGRGECRSSWPWPSGAVSTDRARASTRSSWACA